MRGRFETDYDDVDLHDTLEALQVNELKELIELFDLPVKKSQRKAQLAEGIAECLFGTPAAIVKAMPYYEVGFLRHVLTNPDERFTQVQLTDFPEFVLIRYGIIQVMKLGDSMYKFVLSRPFASVYRRYFREEYNSNFYGDAYRRQKIMLGYTNICGAVEMSDFLQFAHNTAKSKPEVELEELHIGYQFYKLGNWLASSIGAPLQSPYYIPGMSFEPMPADWPTLSRFSQDDALAAGEYPYPQVGISLPSYQKLFSFLRETEKLPLEQAKRLMTSLWFSKQIPCTPTSVIATALKENNIQNPGKFTDLYTDYVNNVPFWKFGGKSSEEIFQQKEAPAAHSFAKGFDDFRRAMSLLNGEPLPSSKPASDKKVGRNDPCPCGSGKNYKHCCGK